MNKKKSKYFENFGKNKPLGVRESSNCVCIHRICFRSIHFQHSKIEFVHVDEPHDWNFGLHRFMNVLMGSISGHFVASSCNLCRACAIWITCTSAMDADPANLPFRNIFLRYKITFIGEAIVHELQTTFIVDLKTITI